MQSCAEVDINFQGNFHFYYDHCTRDGRVYIVVSCVDHRVSFKLTFKPIRNKLRDIEVPVNAYTPIDYQKRERRLSSTSLESKMAAPSSCTLRLTKKKVFLHILALLVVWGCCSCHARSTQTVIVSDSSECNDNTDQKCLTFNDCLLGITACFASNTTILFKSDITGTETTVPCIIRNVENLQLKSYSGNPLPTTVITNVSFMFLNVSNLKISGIAFVHCGTDVPQSVRHALQEQAHSFYEIPNHLRVALFFLNIRTLTIDSIHVNQSIGMGLMAINTLGNTIASSSVFHGNACLNGSEDTACIHETGNANALFLFTDTQGKDQCERGMKPHYTFTVSDCYFIHGVERTLYPPALYYSKHPHNLTGGAGLSVILSQSNYRVSVQIQGITSYENRAIWGANLFISLHKMVVDSSVTVANSSLRFGNISPDLAGASEGGGLFYVYGGIVPLFFVPKCERKLNKTTNDNLTITEVEFFGNFGYKGAGAAIWELKMRCCHYTLIDSCVFANNSGRVSSALYMTEEAHATDGVPPYMVMVRNSVFKDNNLLPHRVAHHGDPQRPGSTITIGGARHIVFAGCNFSNNHVVGIYAAFTMMGFYGNNSFYRNRGRFGGAISLHLDSRFVLQAGARLEFIENYSVYVGGAVYVSSLAYFFLRPLCFYQLLADTDGGYEYENKNTSLARLGTEIYMRGNKAEIAGGDIYGGNVDNCLQVFVNLDIDSVAVFHEVFNTDINFTDPLQTGITSFPLGPCFCTSTGVPNCTIQSVNRTVFSGETFNVSVLGVGQFNGSVPSVIVAEVYADDNYQVDDPDQDSSTVYAKRVDTSCQNVTYHVHAEHHANIILLTATCLNYKYFTKTILVNMKDCPKGFVFDSVPQPTCKCEPRLHGHCNLATGTITRSGTLWVGYSSGSTLYHRHCPFDYCMRERIDIDLDYPDKQCAFHRTGILCGACENGLSLTLGVSHCKECSNEYLALIVPFALAGLLLVFFLFLCNITVTTGTISGVIFYANVVKINNAMFFPPEVEAPLSVFIAWVNLDLGIETCFFDHMDGYAKTWLQFAFPAYIWAIAFAIIIATKYSSFLQKVWGANVVPVLATLYLLSYAKLQRTIITALSCTWLEYDWGKSTVWLYDGNVTCFKGKHLVLALVAIAVVVLFILPVMLLLLFARKLQARSTHPSLKWMNKLKPFLDAYQGPYKDKYRHWTGFMLLVQNLLFLAFALNMEGSPEVNCFVIAVTVLVLLWVWIYSKGVYKNRLRNALECFFLMNLGILSISSLYIRDEHKYTPEKQHIISDTLIGTAFIASMLILGYHTTQRARNIPGLEEKVRNCLCTLPIVRDLKCFDLRSRGNTEVTSIVDEERVATVPQQSFELVITPHSDSSISFSAELREPLLDPDTRANQMPTTST